MNNIYDYILKVIEANRVQPLLIEDEETPAVNTKLVPKANIQSKRFEKEEPISDGEISFKNPTFKNVLLDSQIGIESAGNPNAVSKAKATGLAQFMPETWKEAQRKGWVGMNDKATDPKAAVKAQKALMEELYNLPLVAEAPNEEDRIKRTLAAYNTGYGNLTKAINKAKKQGGDWIDYVYQETKNYVPAIMNKTKREYFKSKENYVPKYERN